MKIFLLASLLLLTPLQGHSFVLKIASLESSIIELSQEITQNLERQVQRKKQELERLMSSVERSQDWQEQQEYLKTLKMDGLYKQQEALIQSLIVLYEISTYSSSLIKPLLLERVSHLIQSEKNMDPILKSFLQKQRVYLMDTTDEAILLNKTYRQVAELQKELSQKLKSINRKFTQTPTYKNFIASHEHYIKQKSVKACISLIQKITSLEYEKRALVIKDKRYQDLMNQRSFLFSRSSCPNLLLLDTNHSTLLWISDVQYQLLVATPDLLLL
jgi:hypothetical protein